MQTKKIELMSTTIQNSNWSRNNYYNRTSKQKQNMPKTCVKNSLCTTTVCRKIMTKILLLNHWKAYQTVCTLFFHYNSNELVQCMDTSVLTHTSAIAEGENAKAVTFKEHLTKMHRLIVQDYWSMKASHETRKGIFLECPSSLTR